MIGAGFELKRLRSCTSLSSSLAIYGLEFRVLQGGVFYTALKTKPKHLHLGPNKTYKQFDSRPKREVRSL